MATFLLFNLLTVVCSSIALLEKAEIKTIVKTNFIRDVGQCFRTKGNPFITLYCGSNHKIKVEQAFHGLHQTNDTDCSHLPRDCLQDQLHGLYDWTRCMGSQHCVQSVKQSWMPDCGNYSQYLQVRYSCIPDSRLLNICDRQTRPFTDGYIISPNYPLTYPASRDCECVLATDAEKHIFISFHELTLEMANQITCGDWLLIQSGTKKTRQSDLNCGHIAIGAKNLTSRSSHVMLHFHSDRNDNKTQRLELQSEKTLKGFWLYFRAEPPGTVNAECHPTKPKKLITLTPSPTANSNLDDTTGTSTGIRIQCGVKAVLFTVIFINLAFEPK